MASKRDLIGNELIQEIIRIRIDGLGKMLEFRKKGCLPRVFDEGATGNLDNKGAIFVPGGLVFEDSDRHPIRKERYQNLTRTGFRKIVDDCMQSDNATLLFQDGYLGGVNLDNGFFAEKSSQILATRQAAKRSRRLERTPPYRIRSGDICKSLCPETVPRPYGSRTKLSSCLAVCLRERRLYYLQCTAEYALRGVAARRAWERIRSTRLSIKSVKGEILAPPYVVVCHQTRYREHVMGGITRILGIGEFGEFATITFELVGGDFAEELREKKIAWNEADVFAHCEDRPVLGVIRVSTHHPGARSRGSNLMLINPSKDLGYKVETLLRAARKQYRLD